MLSHKNNLPFVWVMMNVPLITAFLAMFSFPVNAQDIPEVPPSPAVITKNSGNNESECATLANQYIVFADLHIIQAIKAMLDDNATEALKQLSAANESLYEAGQVLSCQ